MTHLDPQVATPDEARTILDLALDVCRSDVISDTEAHIARAQLLSAQLPERFRMAALNFRRWGDRAGGLLYRNLPTGPLPATPTHADLAVGTGLLASGVLALFAALLGDQFGFAPELSGNAVQDILPVYGFEDTQQSISSTTPLDPHVETAFTDDRADFVALYCLRQDHDGVAGTSFSPVEHIVQRLDAPTISILRQPRFKTTVDGSFLRGRGWSRPIHVGPIEVLSGAERRPRLRCDFAETTGLDPIAEKALERLHEAAQQTAIIRYLEPGDLLFIDNHFGFHGRTAFRARWDGEDRWLLRTFVTRDLSRSAARRPGDGRIVDTDYSRDPNVL